MNERKGERVNESRLECALSNTHEKRRLKVTHRQVTWGVFALEEGASDLFTKELMALRKELHPESVL